MSALGSILTVCPVPPDSAHGIEHTLINSSQKPNVIDHGDHELLGTQSLLSIYHRDSQPLQ